MAWWVAPVAERIARELLKPTGKVASKKPASVPTRLTQANRSAGRDGIRKKSTRPVLAQALEVPNAGNLCGVILEDREQSWCEHWYTEHRAEKDRANIAMATAAKLKMAAEGDDPSHGGEDAEKRGQANREHVRINLEWETMNIPTMTEAEYRKEVLPNLSSLTTNQLPNIMQFSQAYAASV